MMDVKQFKDIYVLEAEEHIQKLNDNILILEKIYSDKSKEQEVKKLLDGLMRSAHTIKSSSAMMGFVKLAFLTHVMEDVFDGARNDKLELTPAIIAKTFDAIDLITKSVSMVKSGEVEPDTEKFANGLKKETGVLTVGYGKSVREGGKEKNIVGAEKNNQVSSEPKPEAEPSGEMIAESKVSFIRVPVERLEILIDLVGELMLDKMRLENLAEHDPILKEMSSHVGMLVSRIQYQVMQVRLVPVEQIFSRFPRMVRDLALAQSKKVDFKIIGSEIEFDRTIVDKLGEPIVHLLRNAVDHGIVKEGAISLKAARENDKALFIVENSGQGIDLEKVRQAAVTRGIITAEKAGLLTEEDLIGLIFHPRLSTRKEVSEISGRGVGLDVVKKFAESLNGSVSVENIESGVRFTLELPLTLAIIHALFVQIEDETFAIPFANVERSVRIDTKDIKCLADRQVAIVNGGDIPLFHLYDIYVKKDDPFTSLEKSATERGEYGEKGAIAVIIKRKEGNIGIVVDKLINVQEAIVKPLSPILRPIKGFSGSTTQGDGRTVLVLDALRLIEEIKR